MARGDHFRLGYRPALDGVRAVAVLLVLAGHTRQELIPGGHIGVEIFFVLSGFLITTLLTQEWQANGRIRLGQFYLRRALRLAPALVALVVVVTIGVLALDRLGFGLDDVGRPIPAALVTLTYVSNWPYAYNALDLGALMHTWSLSIEEQFYLLWPLLLITLLSVVTRPRARIVVVCVLAAVAAGWRTLLWASGAEWHRTYAGLDTRADALLIGCALGLLTVSTGLRVVRDHRRVAGVAAAVGGVILAGASGFLDHGSPWLHAGGFTVVGLGTAAVLAYLVAFDGSRPARLLSLPPVRWIGAVSYGIYLWHFPVFKAVDKLGLPGWLDVPVRVVVSLGVAAVSYYVIERPFLKLKDRKHPPGEAATVGPTPPRTALSGNLEADAGDGVRLSGR